MKRVVVTGMGVISSIGNNTQEVLASLREAKSGIVRADEYAKLGFRCQVHGAPNLDTEHAIDRRALRFLGGGAAWNHAAMEQAIRWTLSVLFDAMGAMSSKFNATPEKASRAYDVDRDGFVIAGGAGVLVLEELDHAKARGARIYAELAGYGATSDGYDMVAPSGEGAARCMQMALAAVKCPVDYINPHATSTPVGDLREIEAIREVFGGECPPISATKSLTGHSLGAAGAQEAIYSLLMMNNGFICESANIDNLDPAFADVPIVRERRDDVQLSCVLSNSFGFGGTNASVVFKRLDA
jgi:3-oxoacyl-[acyl-carrier-protein] synthase-1